MYNITQSSAVLDCLGSYIEQFDYPDIDVFVANIPDHTVPNIETGFLTKNSLMMLTTAVDRLNTSKVTVVGQGGGKEGRRQVQILGAFTELNRTTHSRALNSETVIPGGFKISLGGDHNLNHIALDLAMSENGRIIPGTSISVSVEIDGDSGDVTLTYDDRGEFAAIGALGFRSQEGFHAAQRLLIETAAALVISRYFDLDLKSCLQDSKKPRTIRSRASYDSPIFVPKTIENQRTSSPAFSVREDTYLPRQPGSGSASIYPPPQKKNNWDSFPFNQNDSERTRDELIPYSRAWQQHMQEDMATE